MLSFFEFCVAYKRKFSMLTRTREGIVIAHNIEEARNIIEPTTLHHNEKFQWAYVVESNKPIPINQGGNR